MARVELLYFPDCPNVPAAREQLKHAFEAMDEPPAWNEIDVSARDAPEYARGFGSPTVLVDRRDVAGAQPSDGSSCRIYAESDTRGVPPLEVIVSALLAPTRTSSNEEVTIMNEQTKDDVRAVVRDQYGKVAREAAPSCAPGCCGGFTPDASLKLGYSAEDLAAVPEGANMGLGCGNPQAIAALKPGETVLDLGSGGGFDSFLAAKQVGPTGRVIGVDMTPDMVSKARANATKLGATNVDFRLGEIEHLPLPDATVDVILSNCVINLSPDKGAVFQDAFRVLKPGGRLAISDVVKLKALPEALEHDVAALTGCVSGAATVDSVKQLLEGAGFTGIEVNVRLESREFIRDWLPGSGVEDFVASATIEAVKPGGKACC